MTPKKNTLSESDLISSLFLNPGSKYDRVMSAGLTVIHSPHNFHCIYISDRSIGCLTSFFFFFLHREDWESVKGTMHLGETRRIELSCTALNFVSSQVFEGVSNMSALKYCVIEAVLVVLITPGGN